MSSVGERNNMDAEVGRSEMIDQPTLLNNTIGIDQDNRKGDSSNMRKVHVGRTLGGHKQREGDRKESRESEFTQLSHNSQQRIATTTDTAVHRDGHMHDGPVAVVGQNPDDDPESSSSSSSDDESGRASSDMDIRPQKGESSSEEESSDSDGDHLPSSPSQEDPENHDALPNHQADNVPLNQAEMNEDARMLPPGFDSASQTLPQQSSSEENNMADDDEDLADLEEEDFLDIIEEIRMSVEADNTRQEDKVLQDPRFYTSRKRRPTANEMATLGLGDVSTR